MTLGDNINSKRKLAYASALVLAFAASPMAVGCSGDDVENTGEVDTGVDTGTDTGAPDTGSPDTGSPDTGEMDTKVPPTEFTATPAFEPPSGTTSATPIDVKITSATAGAVIYYTTDGTTPNTSSTKYASPINVAKEGVTTIKAMALAPDKLPSEIATATYTIKPIEGSAAVVTFTPPGGPYENDQSVALASATPAATICYTTDGTTTPTCDAATGACTGTSATYSGGAPIVVNTTGKKISAIACKVGFTNSAVTSATYTLNAAGAVFSPATGSYDAPGITVTATLATAGATVRYTTNGTDPNCTSIGSTFDFAGVSITSNTVFKAITCKSGYNASSVQTIPYNIKTRPVTATPAAGDVNNDVAAVTLAQSAAGAVPSKICWSTGATDPACTGGATPTCTAGTEYGVGAPPAITKATTLKVVACDTNRVPGLLQTFAYTTRVDNLTFDPITGTKLAAVSDVTVTTTTTGATLKYTTDATVTLACGTTAGSGTAWPNACTVVGSGAGTKCVATKGDLGLTADKELRVIACKTDYLPATGSVTYASSGAIAAPVITPAAASGTLNNLTRLTFASTGAPAGTWYCVTTSALATPFTAPSAPDCVAPTSATVAATAACAAGTLYVPPAGTVPSNITINANGQSVKAIACPALTTSTKSGVTTETGYTFKSATTTLNPATGSVGAGQAIGLSTSTVEEAGTADITFHYTSGATTPADPTCATATSVAATNNTAGTAAEASLPGSITNVTGTIIVKVVACKTGYLISDVATGTYTAKTADPVLTPSPDSANNVTVWPASGVNVNSPSGTGTKLCYTWDGGTPTCSALLVCGTSGDATKMGQYQMTGAADAGNIAPAVFGTADVPVSGVTVNAIACRTGLPNSGITSKTYNFKVSAIDFTPSANSWNATTAYTTGNIVTSGGFFYMANGAVAAGTPVTDTAAWTQQQSGNITLAYNPSTATGGPTTGTGASPAVICYTTSGTAPAFKTPTTGSPDPCQALDPATTICNPGPGPVTVPTISRITTVIATGCRRGFASSTGTNTYNVTPYRHTINMAVASNDFTAATEGLPGGGFVTYDNANVYVGIEGANIATTTTNKAFAYFGTGSSLTATAATGTTAPATGHLVNYQVTFQADTGAIGLRFWNGTGWVDAPATGITAKTSGSGTTSFVKLSIPMTTIGMTTSGITTFSAGVMSSAGALLTRTPSTYNYLDLDGRSALAPNDTSKRH